MPDREKLFTYTQSSRYQSPRNTSEILAETLWQYCWFIFCVWTPKPFNRWRLLWLKLFGANLQGTPFVHSLARIQAPWNLIMHDRAALGERASAYSLGHIELREGCTVAQECYLCAATHDFEQDSWPLQTAQITIGEDSFIGARTFVMPGITIGNDTIIGACSVVTKNIPPSVVAAGNPCRIIRNR